MLLKIAADHRACDFDVMPPNPEPYGLPARRAWTDDELALIGTDSDNRWTKAEIALLGTDTDQNLARVLNRTEVAVKVRRLKLKIPAYR